jgi:hypothetical protein
LLPEQQQHVAIVNPVHHDRTLNESAPEGRTLRDITRGQWLGAGRLERDILFPIGINTCGQKTASVSRNSHLTTSYSHSQPFLGSRTAPRGKGVLYFPHTSDPAQKSYSRAVAVALARGRKAPKGHRVLLSSPQGSETAFGISPFSTSLLPMRCDVMHRARVAASDISIPMNCYMGKGGT